MPEGWDALEPDERAWYAVVPHPPTCYLMQREIDAIKAQQMQDSKIKQGFKPT